MLENTVKGLVYQIQSYTMVDKKTGEERGMMNIQYIFSNPDETATRKGWQSGQSWCLFTDELWKGLDNLLLKNVELTYRLVPDYKDSSKYTSKLIKVNDLVIKQ